MKTLLAASLIAAATLTPAMAESKYSPELEAILKKEKADRRACKVEMCSALRNKAPGDDISCAILKTVPKQDLSEKIKRARVSWPWGHAKCEMQLSVPRQLLIDAVSKPEFDAEFSSHTVTCTVARDDSDPYTFKATVKPKISFKGGKAVDGAINWGEVEAPILAKGVIWSATGLDNKVGVFNDDLVEAMNTFMGKKCDEVKDSWKSG